MEFRDITLEDKPQVDACARVYSYHLCEHCFTDLFIWRGHYKTRICFWEGFLLVRMQTLTEQTVMYLAPIGEGDLAAAISMLEQDARENGVPFIMCSIAEEMKPRIEQVMPGRFEYSTDESGWDYIYLSEKLQTLSGKKLQSKRNLVNRFQAAYEGRWSYEDISKANTHDAFQFHIKWCEQNGCMRDQEFWGETCAIGTALNYFDELDMRGGILRLDGNVIAFTLGSQATDDMFVVQIEKADHEIAGAYQMINQQFVKRNCAHVKYVNREEDLGLEGLRKAKRSYHPEMMGVKYCARIKS
ncbi:MAG: phosphatidylglycerol lysyltransferase domain-containing protein [Butyricicoccus sp.]|nr:phosphatidylglycerol lysyltransferase domain-containing protein [Butyricicoccus sp.]